MNKCPCFIQTCSEKKRLTCYRHIEASIKDIHNTISEVHYLFNLNKISVNE